MVNKIDKIEKEIYRLMNLEKNFKIFLKKYTDDNNLKIEKTLKKLNYKYDSSYRNSIIIGNKECNFYLDENGKMVVKIKKCERDPFVKTFFSDKQEQKFNNKIQEIKTDFRNKGVLYTTMKNYLIKKENKPEYIKNSKEISLKDRIDKLINKYNKIKENELIGTIKVGHTYTENIILNGYYSKKLSYLKIIKENPKTYQVEYKIESNNKVVKKRINKEKIREMFDYEWKGYYYFYDKLDEKNLV